MLPVLKHAACNMCLQDKPLISDVVFLRAWVAVELPKLYSMMTDRLAPLAAPGSNAPAIAPTPTDASAGAAAAGAGAGVAESATTRGGGADGAGSSFEACRTFAGARPGEVFKLGSQGLGYYADDRDAAAGGRCVATHCRAGSIIHCVYHGNWPYTTMARQQACKQVPLFNLDDAL